MTLQELYDNVCRTMDIVKLHRQDPSDITVGIRVKRIGTVGPLPVVGIQQISLGIDWDSDKCLITPTSPLRETDADEIAAIQKKFDDMGWAYYEASKKLVKKS